MITYFHSSDHSDCTMFRVRKLVMRNDNVLWVAVCVCVCVCVPLVCILSMALGSLHKVKGALKQKSLRNPKVCTLRIIILRHK